MYYYIFDPPQGAKEYERTAQIKELLSTLGIAGEMTSPIPGRGVEELVQIAIQKTVLHHCGGRRHGAD